MKQMQIFNSLSVCSFNIRFLTKKDEGLTHWDARKLNIVQYLLKKSYDFIGVQEATFPQRKFLQASLIHLYDYIGWGQEHSKDEECGIFVKRSNYQIIFKQFEWISQSKQPKSTGYDAKLPRYFTTVVATPKSTNKFENKIPCFLIINLHLDHKGKDARQQGIRQTLTKCKQIKKQLEEKNDYILMTCMVMGDYNIKDGDKVLKIMTSDKQLPFISMRSLQGADQSITFNGFKLENRLMPGQNLINPKLTIDHIFLWVNQKLKVENKIFRVDKIETETFLSDHYPIVGILEDIH